MTRTIKITVTYDPPPIPHWEKMAWRAGVDGEEERGISGYGASPEAAIADLISHDEWSLE